MEATATRAIAVPPQWPPVIAFTASAKGAPEFTSLSCGTRPKTATVPSR